MSNLNEGGDTNFNLREEILGGVRKYSELLEAPENPRELIKGLNLFVLDYLTNLDQPQFNEFNIDSFRKEIYILGLLRSQVDNNSISMSENPGNNTIRLNLELKNSDIALPFPDVQNSKHQSWIKYGRDWRDVEMFGVNATEGNSPLGFFIPRIPLDSIKFKFHQITNEAESGLIIAGQNYSYEIQCDTSTDWTN